MSNLVLLPPNYHWAGLFADWLNDPEVVKYSEQRHKRHTVETQLDYWRSSITVLPNTLQVILLDNKPIGSISAIIDRPNNVADVGILIGDKSQWGKGYGYQVWGAFCDALLATKVGKIEAGCMGINKPMTRIMEKYGMTLEGNRKDHFCVLDENGLPTRADCLLYGKLKS